MEEMKVDHAGKEPKNSFLHADKKKMPSTIYFRTRWFFDPCPSFHFWSCGLGPRASPGNNRNNFQLGRKEMEFQMKEEREVGALMAMPQGCARAPSPLFSFPPTGSQLCRTWRGQAGRQPLRAGFRARAAGAASAPGARGPFKSDTGRAAV